MPLSTSFTLNTGAKLDAVGLGCWMGRAAGAGTDANAETLRMVHTAIEVGYTHLDTAAGYGNKEAVGSVVRASGKPREHFHVTTKLADHFHVAESFEASYKALNLEYIDLWLMHWPQASDWGTGTAPAFDESPTFSETWAEMEKVYATGRVKAIGVSNFSVKNLEVLLKTAKVAPAVNQVEAHPYCPQEELGQYCKSKGIHLTAYCPMGQYNSPILKEPLVQQLADKYGKQPGSILLSWGVQRGFSVVPKSSNPDRLRQNRDLVELSLEDLAAVSALHTEPGKHRSLCDFGPGQKTKGWLWGWRVKEDLEWN
ncbi:aldo/keto reductase family protein [Rhodotorula paludigena]|uniref:aldo/keto reductase family protein n=1 Tax=Rhodotorula paludigena TaxID=86838 RepID=UPI003176CA6A